jgi:CBS domain-containing membrane protein
MTLRIEELMTTGVIALKAGDTVGQANEQMRTADIRHLPVVDEHFRVVGIISDRDLLRSVAGPKGKQQRIADVMTRDVLTVRPEMPAYRAAEIMIDRKIGSLPVVGDDGVMIGIVTETDFLAIAHKALHGRSGAGLLTA